MNSRDLIDGIFESEAGAAPKEQATVKVELTGSPKSVQKAIQQLARQKPAGVKVKADGKSVAKDGPAPDVKAGPKKDDKKEPKKDEKKEKPKFGRPMPKDDGDDKE